MLKKCKVCGKVYWQDKNEVNTNPYFDNICDKCRNLTPSND